jgi:hypothetical protein
MPVILALGRLMQMDQEFKTSLDYILRPCLGKKKKKDKHLIYLSLLKICYICQSPVAHAYNPSYSEGRDEEECGSKPAQANSFMRPYLNTTHFKKGWSSVSRCRS